MKAILAMSENRAIGKNGASNLFPLCRQKLFQKRR